MNRKRNSKRNNKRKRQKPRNNNRWKGPTARNKEVRRLVEMWKTTEHSFQKETCRLKDLDVACMAMEGELVEFDKSTFIADTGASTHMVNSDDGMFDCQETCEPVMMCNGKKMIATKTGKARMTALQVDGTTTDVVLRGVKHVPGLDKNLFSVLRAIELG